MGPRRKTHRFRGTDSTAERFRQGSLTEDVHHGEAVVVRETDQESAEAERPEAANPGCGEAGCETDDIRAHQCGDPAVAVCHPTEYQTPGDGPSEEY